MFIKFLLGAAAVAVAALFGNLFITLLVALSVIIVLAVIKFREKLSTPKLTAIEQYELRKAEQEALYLNRVNILGTGKPDDWEVVSAIISNHAGVRWYQDDVMDDEIWNIDLSKFYTDRIFIDVMLHGEQADAVKACEAELRAFFAARKQEFAELDTAEQQRLLVKYEDVVS
jgi:hypothetical protein